MKYKYLFFDVEGTLLYKLDLYQTIHSCILSHGYNIDIERIMQTHFLLMSYASIPAKTDKNFYSMFNYQFLCCLGIIPNTLLIDSLYTECKKLSWNVFSDITAIKPLTLPKGIFSNWDSSLEEKLRKIVPINFSYIIGSDQKKISKPNLLFYREACMELHINPNEIIYIGDSVKLDIIPAQAVGIHAILIDRFNRFPWYKGERLQTLHDLHFLLDHYETSL